MDLLIFALIVLVIAALFVAAVHHLPLVPAPFNQLIIVLILVIAAVAIAHRAGVF